MPTVTELGQRIKAKYPGTYDDLSDDQLGTMVKARYPGAYDDFTESFRERAGEPGPSPLAELAKPAGDIVGPLIRTAGALLSTPKAAAIHAIAKTKTPVTFSPTASQEQFEELTGPGGALETPAGEKALLGPTALDILTDLPFAWGLNALGRKVLMPAARAAFEPVRRAPGVKQTLEVFGQPGAALPAKYRPEVQSLIRTAEGEADLRGFLRERLLGKFRNVPKESQTRIATAIERRTIPNLIPEEQNIANLLNQEYAQRVASRVAEGGKAHELGAHIPTLERKVAVAQAKVTATPDRLNKAKLKLAEKRLTRATRGVPQEQRVSFIDRPLPKEAREEMGLKGYGSPMTGGMATGRLSRRISSPGRTTEDINAWLKAQGKTEIPPVVESAMAMGEANDLRVMRLKIVNDLAKKYGQKAAPGERTLSAHTGLLTGFQNKRAAELAATKLPPEIDELVGQLNTRLAPSNWGKLNDMWRTVNQEFKTYALFSPGFVSRNLQNNVIQTGIFGNLDPTTYKRGIQAAAALHLGKGGQATIRIGKTTMKVDDYIQGAIKRGVIGRGQAATEIRGRSANLPGIRHLRDANSFAEDMSRAAFDIYNQDRGMAAMESGKRVDQILFNYSNRLQHPAKKWLRRNAVPFINWSSQIGPLFGRSLLERPGSVGMLGSLSSRANRAAGYSPQDIALLGPDVAKQGGIVVGKAGGDTVRVALPTGYGSYSLNEYVPKNLSVEENADNLATLLYPQLNVPLGLSAGRDPLTNRPFDGSPKPAPQALKSLWLIPGGKNFAQAHGIFITPDGTVQAPDRLAFVLRSVPQLKLPSIIADLVSPGKGSETRLRSYLMGYRELQRSPSVGRSIQTRRQVNAARDSAYIARKYPPEVIESGYRP